MSFSKLPLHRFLSELGSARPAPGGGAAAAVCAALGFSLFEMVLRINSRKHPQKTKQAALVRKKGQICLLILQKDAAAFTRISKLYKTGQKGASYQNALKIGAQVPLKIIVMTNAALKETKKEYSFTSAWLKSDLVEAELLLKAAKAAAALNVEINLKSIEDKAFVAKMRKAMR